VGAASDRPSRLAQHVHGGRHGLRRLRARRARRLGASLTGTGRAGASRPCRAASHARNNSGRRDGQSNGLRAAGATHRRTGRWSRPSRGRGLPGSLESKPTTGAGQGAARATSATSAPIGASPPPACLASKAVAAASSGSGVSAPAEHHVDEAAADPAVIVEEGVDRLELRVGDRRPGHGSSIRPSSPE
jgi:hypothetical protein